MEMSIGVNPATSSWWDVVCWGGWPGDAGDALSPLLCRAPR